MPLSIFRNESLAVTFAPSQLCQSSMEEQPKGRNCLLEATVAGISMETVLLASHDNPS